MIPMGILILACGVTYVWLLWLSIEKANANECLFRHVDLEKRVKELENIPVIEKLLEEYAELNKDSVFHTSYLRHGASIKQDSLHGLTYSPENFECKILCELRKKKLERDQIALKNAEELLQDYRMRDVKTPDLGSGSTTWNYSVTASSPDSNTHVATYHTKKNKKQKKKGARK